MGILRRKRKCRNGHNRSVKNTILPHIKNFDRIKGKETMKKIFAFSVFGLMFAPMTCDAVDWWRQETVCRLDTTTCYPNMGTGYDREMWDASSQCWGMKLICPDALVNNDDYIPVPMGKTDIARGDKIKADFDTDELNGDCFGVRRTTSNGAMASVGDEYVPVWCNTVPLYADEIEQLPNGMIVTSGAQPTCAELALDGYVAIQVGKCYGKYYDPYKYYIQCGTGDLLPERIIVLNGADYTMPSGDAPVDIDAANDIFDKMESVSQTQRSKYFKDN